MGNCHISHLDICKKAGIDCYQKARDSKKVNMSLKDYSKIIGECKKKVFQVALGGAGDPNKHEDFESILKLTREAGIVPNLTTSGIYLTDQEIQCMKKYCGAVVVSFYSRLSNNRNESNLDTINRLIF